MRIQILQVATRSSHAHVNDTYWYLKAVPEFLEMATRKLMLEKRRPRMINNTFTDLLQAFFTERLFKQEQVSAYTVSSYRDAFRLLLSFANENLAIPSFGSCFVAFVSSISHSLFLLKITCPFQCK